MLDCPTCERSHRDQEGIEKCALRAQKREEREAAKRADMERRLRNRQRQIEPDFIFERVKEGTPWERIVSRLNKDYPARTPKWTIYDVVREDCRKLVHTWRADLDTVTLLRMERIFTGDFISKHPLELPVDGSFSMAGQGYRDLEPEIAWVESVMAKKKAS